MTTMTITMKQKKIEDLNFYLPRINIIYILNDKLFIIVI